MITNDIAEQIIFSRGRHDVEFFIDFYLPHYKVDKKTKKPIKSAKFHHDILLSMKNDKNVNIVFPRDHAKTTCSLFDTIHDICYGIEPSTFLVCPETLGIEFIGKVREELCTNKKILKYFGQLVPGSEEFDKSKRRTSSWLQFANGCELQTVSPWGKIRGKRPTKIKVDDPQENKDVKNPVIAEQFVNWFFTSIYNTLDPNGRCIVMWTIISANCFVNMLQQQDRGFRTIIFPAVINPVFEFVEKGVIATNQDGVHFLGRGRMHLIGGKPIRHEKRSLSDLDDRLQVILMDAFLQEYMHEPMIVTGSLVIPKEVILKLKTKEPLYKDDIYDKIHIFAEHNNWLESQTKVSELVPTPSNKITRVDVDGKRRELLAKQEAKTRYSRGVDTAAWWEDGDYSTIEVRDNLGRLMVTYYDRVPPDQLCRVIQRIYELGYYPKRKALGIENNNTWLVTLISARDWNYSWYNDICEQEILDEKTEKKTKKIGRNTNGKTKPILVEWYKQAIIHDEFVTEFDVREIYEMKTFAYQPNGKVEAVKPYHDDLVMASMICLEMIKVNKYSFGGVT